MPTAAVSGSPWESDSTTSLFRQDEGILGRAGIWEAMIFNSAADREAYADAMAEEL